MRAYVLVSTLLALAAAKPEAGYYYPSQPSVSYGIPRGGGIDLGGGFDLGGGGDSRGGVLGATGPKAQAIGSGIGGKGGGGFGVIQKHIYVHVPPPEPEEFRPLRPIATAAPQKHYKIIFIKAPSAPAPTAPVIPLQPQNEEKTLVYVLVKRPEDAPEISIPAPVPTQPSKPEVYFIRYKAQKGAVGGGGIAGGIDEGRGGGIIGGISGTTASSIGRYVGEGGKFSSGDPGFGDFDGGTGRGISYSYGPPGKSGPY